MRMKIQLQNENRLWNIQAVGLGNQNNDRQQVRNGSIFLGKQEEDGLQTRRQAAKKQAMNLVTSVQKSDGKIDGQMNELRNQAKQLQEENETLNKDIKDLKAQRKADMEAYGLTEEDKNTQDYQDLISSYDKSIDMNTKDIKENQAVIAGNAQTNYAIEKERLKSHAMVDAGNEKDALMAAADKEFAVGMINESMEEFNEKLNETVDEAKEKAAEKAEQEKKAAENAKHSEYAKHSGQTEHSGKEPVHTPSTIQQAGTVNQDEMLIELKKIAESMSLLEEDLKGIEIDQIR